MTGMQTDTETHVGVGKLLGRRRDKLERTEGGWRGEGGEGRGGKAVRAAEVSHQHTDIWMQQTAPLIRGRRRSSPSRTGLGHKQVITDPPAQQGSSVFKAHVLHFRITCQSAQAISIPAELSLNYKTTTIRQWDICLLC